MGSYSVLILLWFVALWLVGWLVLPLARRVFLNLPDGGLAAGRVLAVALLSLGAFWGASLRVLPLSLAPLWLSGVPLLCGALALLRPSSRQSFLHWITMHRRALIVSDLLFCVAFLFFVWVRLRQPGINDLEKPMDAALMGSLARAQFLPAENPWFSGTLFTNYYYFGHLMGALLSRALSTPNHLAYNLVQPAFCALFIAPLWSLCAALVGSLRRGIAAMTVVALLGHFEPLRQWFFPPEGVERRIWPINYFSTSRVIPDTINEYPLFTLAIGDAHAHFFALSLAAIFFCLCFALFDPGSLKSNGGAGLEKEEIEGVLPHSAAHRRVVLLLLGVLLGIFTMTNTWDVPTYGILALLCALWTIPSRNLRNWPEFLWALAPLALSRVVAWPYLRSFKAQISGAVWELWLPPFISFLLLWGGFVALSLVVFAVRKQRNENDQCSPPPSKQRKKTGQKSAYNAVSSHEAAQEDVATRFRAMLAVVGVLALLAPMLFYIRGAFGDGPLRHQDTVFKFGMQAWLLIGTAVVCEAIARWHNWPRPLKIVAPLCWLPVPLLCAACVVWARTGGDAPYNAGGSFTLSLDGARHLPAEDREALDWLRSNAGEGESVLEAVGQARDGGIGGDFSEFGRVSALTGVATPLGWPQHAMFWGADWGQINERWQTVRRIYAWPDEATALADLKKLGVRYVYVGDLERRAYDPGGLTRLRSALPVAYEKSDTFICIVPR